jgi:hypothetical protein
MLLSKEEVNVLRLTSADAFELVAKAEAAILAKLGAMELPEPAYFVDACELDRAEKCCLGIIHCTRQKGVFTADQFHRAYAQGAAAQLSSWSVATTTCDCYPDHGGTIYAEAVLPEGTKLYTRREANHG